MKSKISCSKFGTIYNGEKTHIYKVEREDISFCASDFGCIITSLNLRDKDKSFTDIVLGFETLDSYANNWGSFGAIIGRYANRINNGTFTLNGKKYELTQNIDGACLHGGFPAWGNLLWKAKKINNKNSSGLLFIRDFSDGEQGFPGNLHVEIEYLIDDEKQLTMTYTAKTDKETPVSITNHSYFNLAGKGKIHNYKLKMNCNRFIETDSNNFPTGNLISVEGTNNDFRKSRSIKIDEMEKPDYDLCYVTPAYDEKCGIPLTGKKIVKTAEVTDPSSGRKMEVFTNQEGVQLYTAKYVKNLPGKKGFWYMPFEAICLETQSFPDSPNQKDFPPVILKPGQEYKAITVYKFS